MRVVSVLILIVLGSVATVFVMAKPATLDSASLLAATPPMGWNSWDAYGETVSEADIRANAQWMAEHLKSFGWQYVVVDSGWYVTNHSAGTNTDSARFSLDAYGRYTPAVNTIPSAAQSRSFKPLADYVHSLGLKFGIHILRGIPKEAVRKNLPIAGSSFHAVDAANTSDTCPWNPFNYGLDASKPAAQAYYDALAQQYAGWGVDFLKVDCIADHPYKRDEIRLISQALGRTGRPMVLSLSPGPAALEKAEELRQYAQMWRISDDVWDLWHSDTQFPSGIGNQFARAAKWAAFSGPGHWPDADMLPIRGKSWSAGDELSPTRPLGTPGSCPRGITHRHAGVTCIGALQSFEPLSISRSFAGSRGSIMSCRTGLCAHLHYLLGIVEADPPSGLDRRDGITIPRIISPPLARNRKECDGKRVPSFIRLVFAVNFLEERG